MPSNRSSGNSGWRSPGGYDDNASGSFSYQSHDSYSSYGSKKRGNDDFHDSDSNSASGGKKRKRRNRWGDETEKAFIPGMPTILPANLTKDQQELYLVQFQIEELTRKLRTGELGVPGDHEERSPSPEPIYGVDGKRLNTREYRYRKRLEEQRHELIQRMLVMNPEFKPPVDYKPQMTRVSDKVMIPQEEHPEINFVGLLIGPRGNTLKSMEKDTGAKIIIRGKGSVKEGKVGKPLPGEDEPLHAYVTANSSEAIKKAVERIRTIINEAIEVPEDQNDLRKMQLRELAILNGTFREGEFGPRCSNCGSTAHKAWQCPDKPNVTSNVVCSNCGGAGHIAKDCKNSTGANTQGSKIDEEYMSLMAELGETAPAPKTESAPPVHSTGSFSRSSGGGGGGGGGHHNMNRPRAPWGGPPAYGMGSWNPPPPGTSSAPPPPGTENASMPPAPQQGYWMPPPGAGQWGAWPTQGPPPPPGVAPPPPPGAQGPGPVPPPPRGGASQAGVGVPPPGMGYYPPWVPQQQGYYGVPPPPPGQGVQPPPPPPPGGEMTMPVMGVPPPPPPQ